MWGNAVATDKNGYKILEVILGSVFAEILGWHMNKLSDSSGPESVGALRSVRTVYRFSDKVAEGFDCSAEDKMEQITDDVVVKKNIMQSRHALHKLSPTVKLLVHETACAATSLNLLDTVLRDEPLIHHDVDEDREVCL